MTRTVNAGRKDRVADQVEKECKKPEGKKTTKNYYIKKDSNKHDVKKDSINTTLRGLQEAPRQ